MNHFDPREYIHQSNLIESIDDPFEDKLSLLAWKYIQYQPRLSRERVLELHRLITINQLPETEAGHLRKVHVTVGGRACPPPHMAIHLFANWVYDMKGYKNLDPIQMHIRFEKTHPFIDGNGRTGRMLLWWHQLMVDKVPSLFTNEEKFQEYYPLFD